jgi:hypothetical protein
MSQIPSLTDKYGNAKKKLRIGQGRLAQPSRFLNIPVLDSDQWLAISSTHQGKHPFSNLAAYVLEPESDDGLLVWNFFDRYLVPQWSREPQTYPIRKLLKPVNLVKESVR